MVEVDGDVSRAVKSKILWDPERSRRVGNRKSKMGQGSPLGGHPARCALWNAYGSLCLHLGPAVLRGRGPWPRGAGGRHAGVRVQLGHAAAALLGHRGGVRAAESDDLLLGQEPGQPGGAAAAGGRRARASTWSAAASCSARPPPGRTWPRSSSPAWARPTREIRQAIDAGIGLFNVESEAEFENLARLARAANRPVRRGPAAQPRRRPQDAHLHRHGQEGDEVRRGHRAGRAVLRGVRPRTPTSGWSGMHLHIGSPIYWPRAVRGGHQQDAGADRPAARRGLHGGHAGHRRRLRGRLRGRAVPAVAATYAAAIVPLLKGQGLRDHPGARPADRRQRGHAAGARCCTSSRAATSSSSSWTRP